MPTKLPTSFTLEHAGFAAGALIFSLLTLATVADLRAEVHAPSADPASPNRQPISTLTGRALVIDGDTLEIDGQRVRLEGIDAPEIAQTCGLTNGETWPCGRAASKALSRLVAGSDVACDSQGTDKYGRILGICFSDGRALNAVMVETGLAWAFVKYSALYVAEEQSARAGAIGIWQGPSEAPWDFRHKGWQSAEAAAPRGCAIKGNVSNNGRIYHMPWSPWYSKVTIDAARGEQWFCSESDAQSAGWRAAAAAN